VTEKDTQAIERIESLPESRRRPSETAIRACLHADAILAAVKRFRLRTLDFAGAQAEITKTLEPGR
jgi:hypothetical protein